MAIHRNNVFDPGTEAIIQYRRRLKTPAETPEQIWLLAVNPHELLRRAEISELTNPIPRCGVILGVGRQCSRSMLYHVEHAL